jgi:hypothetical protein
MKKNPIAKTEEAQYPTHVEARRDRRRWMQMLAIGAAAMGAASLAGCDTIDRLLGRDDGCDIPLGGVAPPLIEHDPPGDDDDSAAPVTTSIEGDEARPDAHVRGKMVAPEQ